MGNWAMDVYDTLKAMETAVEAIDSSTTIHVFGFKEGALQKTVVIKAT